MKRAKSEADDPSMQEALTGGSSYRTTAKQKRQQQRQRGRGALSLFVSAGIIKDMADLRGEQLHYGVPDYVEKDKQHIIHCVDVASQTPWSQVEQLQVSDKPIFDPVTIAHNPSYLDDSPTCIDDEPDSSDVRRQASWDWRLLKVFWDLANQHSLAGEAYIAPGLYPRWFDEASVKEAQIVLRRPDRTKLPNMRKFRKIITNLGTKDRMPEHGVLALGWLYGNSWPYGDGEDEEGDEDYLDYPPNVEDYRTFLARADPAWVKYLMAMREIALIRVSIMSMPTDRRFEEGSFLRALIRRMSPENEARLELEALEKEYDRLNMWARERWIEECQRFDKEQKEHPPEAEASASASKSSGLETYDSSVGDDRDGGSSSSQGQGKAQGQSPGGSKRPRPGGSGQNASLPY